MARPEASIVLLVENSRILRKSEAVALRDLGYMDIITAGDGAEAWSMVRSTLVHLVISSWLLNENMSGLGLLRIVRGDINYSSLPFILIVDEITRNQVVSAGEAGVTDIVVRPFTREILKRKVDQSLTPEEDQQSVQARQLVEKGQQFLKDGRMDEALNVFKKVLTVYENAEVYYNLGYIKTAQGKYEEAIMAFRKATQINAAFAQAHQKMGEALAKLGRAKEAQECFEKAAEIFMEKNMDQKAEDVFMQALQVNPGTLNVYNSLGILYRRQGKFQDSIRMYRKALKVSPFDEHIHYNLARVHVAAKESGTATEILEMALKLNPDFIEARNLLKALNSGAASAKGAFN
ncbi:MAG: tetratricopeptide repeat protein [Deltaproteobacteria bacterium]|nr:tetratricopeptide repeat protein [Deltaproteobacteria bacterium]